jgi:recombination protein RecA
MPAGKKKTLDTSKWTQKKATDSAISRFEEVFGKEMGFNAVRGADDSRTLYEVIPTGSIAFDEASGIGGIPRGRVVQFWGPEHAGKTTCAMRIVAQAQKKYPEQMTAWVDMEQTFDWAWAIANGVDPKRLWLIENPKTAEDVADATRRFVESGLCSIVVLDSIGGMIGRTELEKEADESTVAIVAGIVTRMVKACSPMGRANNTTTLVINQVRARIGGYGPDTHTGGGWALKHITTMQVKVSRGGETPKTVTVEGKAIPVGHEISAKFEKNKCAPYGRVANFWLFNQATDKYGPVGVDITSEALDYGTRLGIIAGKGTAWLTLPGGERFNGADKARAYLYEHPEIVEAIRVKVLEQIADQVHEDDEKVSDADAGFSSMEEFMAAQAATVESA